MIVGAMLDGFRAGNLRVAWISHLHAWHMLHARHVLHFLTMLHMFHVLHTLIIVRRSHAWPIAGGSHAGHLHAAALSVLLHPLHIHAFHVHAHVLHRAERSGPTCRNLRAHARARRERTARIAAAIHGLGEDGVRAILDGFD